MMKMIVEWALLADYVETAGNKLYMMGGGWDALTINNPQRTHSFGILATFRAEGRDLDRSHDVAIQIVHDETETTIVDIQGNVEFAGASERTFTGTQLAHFGLNLTLDFQDEGLFHLIVREESQVLKTFPFYVAFGHGLRDWHSHETPRSPGNAPHKGPR